MEDFSGSGSARQTDAGAYRKAHTTMSRRVQEADKAAALSSLFKTMRKAGSLKTAREQA